MSSAAGRDRTKPFLPEGNGLAAEGQPADPVRSCRRTQQRETVPPGSLQLPSRQVIQSRFGALTEAGCGRSSANLSLGMAAHNCIEEKCF